MTTFESFKKRVIAFLRSGNISLFSRVKVSKGAKIKHVVSLFSVIDIDNRPKKQR